MALAVDLLVPADGDTDVAWHITGEIHHLVANPVAARLQMIGPELEYLSWDPGQRRLPTLFRLVDGASSVGTQGIGEPIDLHLLESVSHRALDYRRSELDLVRLRKAGRFAELFDQLSLLRVHRGFPFGELGGLLGLLDRRLLLDFLCARDQVVNLRRHPKSSLGENVGIKAQVSNSSLIQIKHFTVRLWARCFVVANTVQALSLAARLYSTLSTRYNDP